MADERTRAGYCAVHDPHGAALSWLQQQGAVFTVVTNLSVLPAEARVLVIGKDALDERISASSALAAWASAGRRIVVLEQKHPLRYQGLPCEMAVAHNEGRVAFAEDLEHPALRGLQQKDFFTWPGNAVVYRDAYVKPTRGAQSLVQCDHLLQHSALVEVPVGPGLMLLSQLLIAEKLTNSIVAQHLLANLMSYAASYQLEFRPVASVVTDPMLIRTLAAIGLKHSPADDLMAALPPEGNQIALVSATPAHLKTLAGQRARLDQFTQAGGWLVLHGLAPEGLDDFNRLVGFDHMIRPFRRERVIFPPIKNHLTSGLTLGEVALYSSERIFPWQEGQYVADDTFSYVVDYDEVAPFAKFPADYFHNMVNGMVSADAWKYIFSFELKRGDAPEWEMAFPREQEFTEFTWIGNAFYHLVTRVELTFDSKEKAVFDTPPNNQPQTFAIDPPRKARVIRAKLAEWQKVAGKNDVVGVDNIYFKVKRPPEFYARVKPMLNVGALMEYPRGAGGLVLCNVQFKASESPPINGAKKQAILATILRNLKAPFAGGPAVIAGANLRYTPIDLSKHANQFRDERGWFGDKQFTFADLPVGRQTFAGVPFEIFHFETSPVPTVLMLGGRRVPNNLASRLEGIPVNCRADALFFLHTMRLDQRLSDHDRRRGQRWETLRYVVTYADGQMAEIPIYAEVDLHDYRQKAPQPIPGAQLAWTKPYVGTEWHAVAYAKQWNNPRPEVRIRSLTMVYGKDPRGVPALLALTAATATDDR